VEEPQKPKTEKTRKKKVMTKKASMCTVYACKNVAHRKGLCRKHMTELAKGQGLTDHLGRATPTPIQAQIRTYNKKSPLEISEDGDDDLLSQIQMPSQIALDIQDKPYDELMKEALYWQSEQRKESALKTKRQNEILEGKIIDVDSASQEAFEMLSVLVGKLRQVQYVLTPLLVNQSNPQKIQGIIEKEFNKAFANIEEFLSDRG
jgi:hypothetical protein